MPKRYGPDGKPIKNIMRSFRLEEISAVDKPAQEGARMVLMKRHDSGPEKIDGVSTVFTSSDEGHQHGIVIDTYGDGEMYIRVRYALSEGAEEEHDHEVMIAPDGKMIISENAGHSHEIDMEMVQQMVLQMALSQGKSLKSLVGNLAISADDLGKQPKESIKMAEKDAAAQAAEELKKRANQAAEELKKRDDQIADLNAIVNLSPEHRAHYDTLPDTSKAVFLHSAPAARSETIQKAAEADPVVYEAGNGDVFRKSDDPRLIKMARERDEERSEFAKYQVERDHEAFAKQARDDMDLIPGEEVAKIALLRSVSKIDDETVRTEALKMLKAANKVFKLAMTTRGVSAGDPPAATTAKQLLKDRVSKVAEDDNISEEVAYAKYLETPEGQKVYEAARQERIANTPVNN